jgi:uncharacterized protein YggE
MNENHITALGHGEAKAKSDVASVVLTVVAAAADQAEAVQQNAELTAALIRTLREIGVTDQEIQTQYYHVQPDYDRQVRPPVLSGYQVQNSLEVVVRDLPQVGLVIDRATADNTIRVDGVSFGLFDRAQAEAEALSQAVVSAQRKAGVMAAAAGVKLGRLLSITEGQADAYSLSAHTLGTPSDAPLSSDTSLVGKQITVNAYATLVYAMNETK